MVNQKSGHQSSWQKNSPSQASQTLYNIDFVSSSTVRRSATLLSALTLLGHHALLLTDAETLSYRLSCLTDLHSLPLAGCSQDIRDNSIRGRNSHAEPPWFYWNHPQHEPQGGLVLLHSNTSQGTVPFIYPLLRLKQLWPNSSNTIPEKAVHQHVGRALWNIVSVTHTIQR